MIKNFNEFSINENFSNSKDYEELLKLASKNRSFFFDNLEEVGDLGSDKVKIRYHKSITDSNGFLAQSTDSDSYFINYMITILYTYKNEYKNADDFYKIIDDINTIKICTEEMIDRCSEQLKLTENSVISSESKSFAFVIKFSQEISKELVVNAYNSYRKSGDKEYIAGLKKLEDIYSEHDVDLYQYFDTQEVDDYIDIGFVTEDEIYVIGRYDRNKKRFTIIESGIADSLDYLNNYDEEDDFFN